MCTGKVSSCRRCATQQNNNCCHFSPGRQLFSAILPSPLAHRTLCHYRAVSVHNKIAINVHYFRVVVHLTSSLSLSRSYFLYANFGHFVRDIFALEIHYLSRVPAYFLPHALRPPGLRAMWFVYNTHTHNKWKCPRVSAPWCALWQLPISLLFAFISTSNI